jgi:cell division GTPase FtsZ
MRGETDGYPDPQRLVVVGHGGVAGVAESLGLVPGVTSLSEPPASTARSGAITVLVTDFADGAVPPISWLERLESQDGLTLAVVAAPATAANLDPDTAREVARLRTAVDATVVIPPSYHREGIRSVVTTLHELIARPGVINLDPADVRTVLDGTEAAAITTGTAEPTGDVAVDAVTAVEQALAAPYTDVNGLGAVLVNVVGGTDLTLASAVEAVDGIQQSIPDEAVLIWGVAVEDGVSGVHAQVVASSEGTPAFDDVLSDARQPAAGDNCPRCGGHVAVYSLGDRETAACDDCGYSGTTTTL